MPEEGIYTIRGKNSPSKQHKRIQLSRFLPTDQYVIVEFKIMPQGERITDAYGTISMGKNDSIDPAAPDFSNQNEIAWAHQLQWQNGTALPGSESFVLSNYEVNDDKIFAYDIWIHTVDVLDNSDINWMLKVRRYHVSEVTGSIASLRQNQYNQQGSA